MKVLTDDKDLIDSKDSCIISHFIGLNKDKTWTEGGQKYSSRL